MSPRRARLLVATVWILSFVICFPPLVGWKDKRVTITNFDNFCCLPFSTTFLPLFTQSHPAYNMTFAQNGPFNTTTILVPVKPCPWICELTNDAGYVVYRWVIESFANRSTLQNYYFFFYFLFHPEGWFFKGGWKVLLWRVKMRNWVRKEFLWTDENFRVWIVWEDWETINYKIS